MLSSTVGIILTHLGKVTTCATYFSVAEKTGLAASTRGEGAMMRGREVQEHRPGFTLPIYLLLSFPQTTAFDLCDHDVHPSDVGSGLGRSLAPSSLSLA